MNLKSKIKLYKIYNSIISILLIVSLLMLINSNMTINRLVLDTNGVLTDNTLPSVNTSKPSISYDVSNLLKNTKEIEYLKNEILSLKNEIATIKTQLSNMNTSVDYMNDGNKNQNDDTEHEDGDENEPGILINYDIYNVSGLSTEMYFNILTTLDIGYGLEEHYSHIADSIYNSEHNYNVNGVFILSVMIKMINSRNIKCNNLFGLMSSNGRSYRVYESYQDSISYFAKLIRNRYFENGILTISDISKIYVPYKANEWEESVNIIISHIKALIDNEIVFFY